MENKKSGVELIADERQEQITKHGWTPQHDRQTHYDGELVLAALALLHPSTNPIFLTELGAPEWAINIRLYKERCENGEIELLKVAGALIAAEIDRLNNVTTDAASDTEGE